MTGISAAARGPLRVAKMTTPVRVTAPLQGIWRRPVGHQLLRLRLRVLADPVDFEDRDNASDDDENLRKALRRRVSQVASTAEVMKHSSLQITGFTTSDASVQLPGMSIAGSSNSGLHVLLDGMPSSDVQDPQQAGHWAPALQSYDGHASVGGADPRQTPTSVSLHSRIQQLQAASPSSSSAASQGFASSSESASSSSGAEHSSSIREHSSQHDQQSVGHSHPVSADEHVAQASSTTAVHSQEHASTSEPGDFIMDKEGHALEQHPRPTQDHMAAGIAVEPALAQQQQHLSSTISQQQQLQSQAESSGASGQPQNNEQHQHVPGIPQPILIISLVSASLTMASCVFNTLLPIYMVTELKMTMRSMGMFEGLLEAFSYIVRMFSGIVSDMMTSRKSAITLGFAMGAMAKFGMSGATEIGSLFASKAVDRLANGVQAAPRDAMISDLAPEASRGSCFGFAQSMRKWGSAVGAVMVYFLMKASGNNYQLIFTMAATLSLASCAAFVLLVPSHIRPQQAPAPAAASATTGSGSGAAPAQTKEGSSKQLSELWHNVINMGSDFYRMLLIVCLYGMGHISEALLESRAMEVGFGKAESTLVVASLAFVIFVVAYPLGRLDDRFGPRVTFAVGMAALIAGNLLLLISGTHPWAVFGSLLFMGVHMGVIQGPLLSIVVGLAPAHLRGTAFGIFYTVMALTAVGANSLFGTLWTSFGAPSAFAASAGMTTLTLLALPWLLPEKMRGPKQLAVPARALA